jgi:hypothetical protein
MALKKRNISADINHAKRRKYDSSSEYSHTSDDDSDGSSGLVETKVDQKSEFLPPVPLEQLLNWKAETIQWVEARLVLERENQKAHFVKQRAEKKSREETIAKNKIRVGADYQAEIPGLITMEERSTAKLTRNERIDVGLTSMISVEARDESSFFPPLSKKAIARRELRLSWNRFFYEHPRLNSPYPLGYYAHHKAREVAEEEREEQEQEEGDEHERLDDTPPKQASLSGRRLNQTRPFSFGLDVPNSHDCSLASVDFSRIRNMTPLLVKCQTPVEVLVVLNIKIIINILLSFF